MPAVDPQVLAAILRSGAQAQGAMAGQGAITDRERAYINQMAQSPMMQQNPVMGMNGLAGQGAITEAERAKAMQAMGQMGQGMGQMSDADRQFLMMQRGQ